MKIKLPIISARILFATAIVIFLLSTNVHADPLPGRDVLKFSQRPMIDTQMVSDAGFLTSYHGHGELSTAWSWYSAANPGNFNFIGYQGTIMTDDFADRFNSPVVHVKWWGSYLNNPGIGVDKFLITFGGGYFGGNDLAESLSQVVVKGALSPGSGTFTERQVSAVSVDGPIYEYNAELYLGKEFDQQANRNYSLSIAALVDIAPNQDPLTDPSVIRWGWNTRDYTINNPLASGVFSEQLVTTLPPNTPVWQFGEASEPGRARISRGIDGTFVMPNVSVSSRDFQRGSRFRNRYRPGTDGPLAIGQVNRDLAFELYTVPEPGSCVLLAIGAICSIGTLRRRRSEAGCLLRKSSPLFIFWGGKRD